MKNLEQNKGITLIALIITIIILLILAVVSIRIVLNEGIIKYAQSATEKYSENEELEKVKLAATEALITGLGKIKEDGMTVAMNGQFRENEWEYTEKITEYFKVKIKSSEREYKIYTNGTIEVASQTSTGDQTIEISVTELEVVDVNGNVQTEAQSVTSGSLYIQFKATLDGGTIHSATIGETTVTPETDGTYKYEVTANGTFDFSIKGTADGTEYNKTVSVTVNHFKVEEVKTLAELVQPSNYGDTIEYSANGVQDWKIFYNDGTNVFIITSDCISNEKVPAELGLTKIGTIGVYWENLDSRTRKNIDSSVANKFMAEWVNDISGVSEDMEDIKIASDLINSAEWTSFVREDMQQAGAMAIGSPTAEMWLASWNTKGSPLGYPMLYKLTRGSVNNDYTRSDAYRMIPWGSTTYDDESQPIVSSDSPGYSDSLYWGEYYYFGSTPGAIAEYDWGLFCVAEYGTDKRIITSMDAGRSTSYFNGGGFGLRPVVCLPANAIATQGEGTWTNLGLAE